MDALSKLDGQNLSMPFALDADGYFDRQCPSEDCRSHFKVLMSDWKGIFKDEAVFCPFCRHEAPSVDWNNEEQAKQIKSQALGYISNVAMNHAVDVIRAALKGTGSGYSSPVPHPNRKTQITIKVNAPGLAAKHVFIPITATEAFTLKVKCEECSAHYAVVGSGFFCPNCGHNSAERTFDDAIRKVSAKLDYATLVRGAAKNANQLDEGELVARSLVETALSDCVSALQRLCEELFKRHLPNEIAPFNIFQRIEPASELWRRKIGAGYEDWLSDAQLQEMKMLYQRRHLLAHSEGMVDDMYLQKSQDNSYKAGQRIVVKEKDVRSLIDYVSTIASGLKGAMTSA
jgi:uncharacterized Zn finger protein (UPF0148 family)